jgi:HK97 family phage portal protein
MGLFGRRNRSEEIAQQAATAAAEAVSKQLSSRQSMHLAQWRFQKADRKLQRPYTQLPIVYAAINAKAKRIARTPIVFYRAGSDRTVDSHPAIERFRKPSPMLTRALFLQALVINKDMSGEWFVYKDQDLQRGVPRNLWVYPRGVYEPMQLNNTFQGWEVRPSGKTPFRATNDEVIFDRYYHPFDEVRGLSPLEAAWIGLDTEYEARRYNNYFFKNDATPGQTYTTDSMLTDEQYERLKRDLIDDMEGVEHSHSAKLLDNGLKPVTASLSQKDAQFIEQMGLTLHDICAVFGVDPAVIGFEAESKYASAKEARRYFWTDTLIPEMRSIEERLNDGFFRQYDIEMSFDTQNIEALAYTVVERVEAAEKLVGMGFSPNEVNERLDLGFEERPERDEIRQPPQPMQLEAPKTEGKEYVIGADNAPAEGDVNTAEANKAYRAKRWKEVTDKVNPTIGNLRKQLRTYFHDVEGKILRELFKQIGENAITKDIQEEVDVAVIGAAVNADKLERIVTDFITQGGKVGYESIVQQSFDVVPANVMQYVKTRGGRIKEVAENARLDIQQSVQDAIEEAINEGMSEQAAADLLTEKLKGKMKQLDRRTRTIARTEVHSAFSAGRQEAMAETKPDKKLWISARDSNVRDSHEHLDGQQVGWQEKFKGFHGSLQYPLDPSAPPEEVINCRCIVEPVYEDGD